MDSAGDYIDPLIGTMVGRYRIESKLGQGGMGSVYSLLQPAIHKRLALKLLHEEYAERQEIVRRFFDEARAVNLIGHPNIVDISDFSHLPDGRPFIIMEYLDGESLEDYLDREGRLDVHEAMVILKQICSALGAAHAKDIVHRDLKPENIYLVRLPDGALQVKILDFGIAKLKDRSFGDGEQNATQTGVVLGTPTYMSPEQAEGKTQAADHRTDIYSLGIMIYQMFAGTPPFKGQTFAELILKHIHHAAPDLNENRQDLSILWGQLVARALSKDPSKRFQSMSDLYDHALKASEDPLPASAHTFEPEDATSSRPTNILESVLPPTRDGSTAELRTPPPPPPVAEKLSVQVSAQHEIAKPKRPILWVLPLVIAAGGATAFFASGSGDSEDSGGRVGSAESGPTLVANPAESADADVRIAAIDAAPAADNPGDAASERPPVTGDDKNSSEKKPSVEDDAEKREKKAAEERESKRRAERRKAREAKVNAKRSSHEEEKGGTGTLSVTSLPTWGYVSLDGKRIGTTPITNLEIPSGAHKVRVKNDTTGETRSFRFRLKKDGTETIRFNWKH